MKKQVEDKKTALLEAALKLFTERGFHGTSTAHISKEAGVATGTLFNYFPTKEDLINGLYFEVKGELSRKMGKDVQTQKTYEEKLRKMWYNLVEWGTENQDKFLFVGQFCSSPYITSHTREVVMEEYVFFHDLVTEGLENGELGDYPSEMITSMFYQSSRTIVDYILYSGPQDKNEAIENGFKIVWGGLVKK
ncbi:TetR/AcrR family transcriptional regulator [Methanolobus profundi]|uniref:DNA-binding transcriptional regulator, AcrR family n=1 Tax=Methanolobus profundi TaxID=487685 RepID=A0A1I4S3Y4_9EURY|nr:TetR/AcrR family transcriptional regulator [Methanolobus profundi]SFM59218.1 DNA-binding transcriptional regulator, AcrR family [Methanolobus profundi]